MGGKGSGRRKGEFLHKLVIRLSPANKAFLDEMVKNFNCSKNEIVNFSLEKLIKIWNNDR